MARRRGHSEEQMLAALRQAEGGTTVAEICRDVGISEQTFYVWKRKYAGLGLSELRELRQLREENTKLKRLVADRSLDRHMLQEIVRKKLYGLGTGGRWPAGRTRPIRSVSAGSRGWCRGHARRCGIRGIVIRRTRCACGCERWRRAECGSGIGDSQYCCDGRGGA
jgi:putative transposase